MRGGVDDQVAAAKARSQRWVGGLRLVAGPVSIAAKAKRVLGQWRAEVKVSSESDDAHQSLLKRVKRNLRSPWFFRFAMIVWKLLESLDRD